MTLCHTLVFFCRRQNISNKKPMAGTITGKTKGKAKERPKDAARRNQRR
jgi:hypothetical protein